MAEHLAPEAIATEVSIHGMVSSKGPLYVLPGGCVFGTVGAQRVVIAGFVDGDVDSHESIEILPGAEVRGSLAGSSLTIEEGARFEGTCHIGQSDAVPALPESLEPGAASPAAQRWFWQR